MLVMGGPGNYDVTRVIPLTGTELRPVGDIDGDGDDELLALGGATMDVLDLGPGKYPPTESMRRHKLGEA